MILTSAAHAGFIIVANSDTELSSISKAQLKKVYLKKVPLLPNGKPAAVTGLKEGDARDDFIKSILHKSEASLHSYWSRLMFSGRGEPPRLFKTEEELLEYIRKTPGAIGFVDSNTQLGENVVAVSVQ